MSTESKSDYKPDLSTDYHDVNGDVAVLPVRDWSVDEERRAKRKYVTLAPTNHTQSNPDIVI